MDSNDKHLEANPLQGGKVDAEQATKIDFFFSFQAKKMVQIGTMKTCATRTQSLEPPRSLLIWGLYASMDTPQCLFFNKP